jgi:hypothetical protein
MVAAIKVPATTPFQKVDLICLSPPFFQLPCELLEFTKDADCRGQRQLSSHLHLAQKSEFLLYLSGIPRNNPSNNTGPAPPYRSTCRRKSGTAF